MRKLNIIFMTIILSAIASQASAASKPGMNQIYEKYEKQLQAATTARDSVRILYYLFDLSDRKGQIKHAWEIYNTAGRADNVTAQLDMLRNLGTFFASNDSVVNHLLSLTDHVQNPNARASTRTFILNQRLSRMSRHPEDTEFQMILLDSITKSHNLAGDDIYDQIAVLYQIIQYLGVDADGLLFKECLDRYAQLMESLPASDYPLKNQFYTTAAMIHSRINGNPVKAIYYDRQLLEIIEQLQQMYAKKNRTFRNYDTNKFISYRRILSNYPGLTDEEIEIIHDSIISLYNRDPDVRRTMDTNKQAFAFYLMAKKNYEEAIPALKGILKISDLSAYQKQKFNSMIMEAAKEIGDHSTYVTAMEEYIINSKQIDSLRKVSMKRELMLRDSIMPTKLLYRETSSREPISYRSQNNMQLTLFIISGVLAVLLIIYIVLYFRLRLRKSNP